MLVGFELEADDGGVDGQHAVLHHVRLGILLEAAIEGARESLAAEVGEHLSVDLYNTNWRNNINVKLLSHDQGVSGSLKRTEI